MRNDACRAIPIGTARVSRFPYDPMQHRSKKHPNFKATQRAAGRIKGKKSWQREGEQGWTEGKASRPRPTSAAADSGAGQGRREGKGGRRPGRAGEGEGGWTKETPPAETMGFQWESLGTCTCRSSLPRHQILYPDVACVVNAKVGRPIGATALRKLSVVWQGPKSNVWLHMASPYTLQNWDSYLASW